MIEIVTIAKRTLHAMRIIEKMHFKGRKRWKKDDTLYEVEYLEVLDG